MSARYEELDLGWEYLIEAFPLAPSKGQLMELVNQRAIDGWRLVAINSGFHYFERKARELRATPPKSDRPNPAS